MALSAELSSVIAQAAATQNRGELGDASDLWRRAGDLDRARRQYAWEWLDRVRPNPEAEELAAYRGKKPGARDPLGRVILDEILRTDPRMSSADAWAKLKDLNKCNPHHPVIRAVGPGPVANRVNDRQRRRALIRRSIPGQIERIVWLDARGRERVTSRRAFKKRLPGLRKRLGVTLRRRSSR
jgi:hypothetical protein